MRTFASHDPPVRPRAHPRAARRGLPACTGCSGKPPACGGIGCATIPRHAGGLPACTGCSIGSVAARRGPEPYPAREFLLSAGPDLALLARPSSVGKPAPISTCPMAYPGSRVHARFGRGPGRRGLTSERPIDSAEEAIFFRILLLREPVHGIIRLLVTTSTGSHSSTLANT